MVAVAACGDGGGGGGGANRAEDAALTRDADRPRDARGAGDGASADDARPLQDAQGIRDADPPGDATGAGGQDAIGPPPESAEREIGPQGGVLVFEGVRLVVPPRALADVRRLRISFSDAPSPAGYALRSPVDRFEPAGTQFAVPASLTMAFDRPEVPAELF